MVARTVIAGLLAAATGVAATPLGMPAAAPRTATYAWPVRPFEQPHAIRGTYGEPRTWFDGAPDRESVYAGRGSFAFHQGVDVVAPDGTPVYAVLSGVVHRGARTVVVDSGRVRVAYWHIVPSVANGTHAIALRTVLGRVRRSYGHVHLTELDDGVPVDPLSTGHLRPVADDTPPRVSRITLRHGTTAVLPHLVRGRVDVVAEAHDVGGGAAEWAGLPVAPARVSWHVESTRDGTRTAEQVVFDARRPLPDNRAFWQTYARGTWQNMPTFAGHRYWRVEGVFLYRLGTLDTRRLHDGSYTVVVSARDAAGNRGVARLTFLVWNKPGLPPVTPQA